MSSTRILVSLCLLLATASLAGGAASLVGKNSARNQGVFSSAVQNDFMSDCSKDASTELCSCVLEKLQQKYTEDEYVKLDADLRNEKKRPAFTDFISKSVDVCTKEIAEESTSSGISREKATEYVENYFQGASREEHMSGCKASQLLGIKDGRKMCGCVYDLIKTKKQKFIQMVMDYGTPEDGDLHWQTDVVNACAPEKFTPEVERNLVNFLNQNSVPLSHSKCIVKILKKEYTLKSFLISAMNNTEDLVRVMTPVLLRCVAE